MREADPEGARRDIVVFTLHKAGSTFLHQLCTLLSARAGIAYHSPNDPNGGVTARRLLTDKEIWRSRHGCFAPIRFYVDLPLANYDVILHLRDPRDVLVSMFYSYCYTHGGEIPGNTGYRNEVARRGIDSFVVTKATETVSSYRGDYGTGGHVQDITGSLAEKYRKYIDHLLGRENVTFLKYEEMVTDFEPWLEKFVAPFPISDKKQLTHELAARSSEFFPRRDTDVMSHVRHVAPGDHKNKLRPETIATLNAALADILRRLDYAI